MKTLLLTDIPPCANLTAGIVTAQMCRFVPEGELAIFCVQNPHLSPETCPDLGHVPMRVVEKPTELGRRRIKGWNIGVLGAMAIESYKRLMVTPALVKAAVAYGREQDVTSVWATLQGQTMVRMAARVARGLGVTLRTQVWDPLGWWLDAHGVDPLNKRLDLALFDRTQKEAKFCATASWAMAQHYAERYRVPSEAIIASFAAAAARRPAPRLRNNHELAIGMAGQFYANDEWLQLVRALDYAGWQVSGRRVVLRVLGHHRPTGVPQDHLDFLGWRQQNEVIEILSETCDISYCPYPYARRMEEVAKLSFPSKIPTYLAAGRPILFHGPSYASPARYLEDRGAGFLCRALEPDAVYDGMLHLTEDVALYQRLALAAQKAFMTDFTLDHMGVLVCRFLGYEDRAIERTGARRI